LRTNLDGILRLFQGLRPGEVTDGLSNTALASERMSGKELRKPTGMANMPLYLTDGGFTTACTELLTPEDYVPDIGLEWRGFQPRDLTYSHYAQPNNSHWDCQSYSVHLLNSARSWHSGGVQVLYADGHVAWASSHIDLVTWQALGTVAGGETFAEPSP
jgi:prepilin-type processing-associated H-X9-DG protein